jgi:hypothetical protein
VFTSCRSLRLAFALVASFLLHRLIVAQSSFPARVHPQVRCLPTSPPPTGLPRTGFTLATRVSLLRCAQAGQGFQCRRAVAPTVFSSYFPATMHVL